jgi:cell wall-associated NlpC family hydrolase
MRCAVEAAALRAEPRGDAEQLTQTLRGDRLTLLDERDGWAYVETSYGYPGWVRADELCGDTAVDLAHTFLGTPYEWGGLTARGIDCSGLVHLAYRLAGTAVPRDSWQQDEVGLEIRAPEPGDLVTYGDPVDHVAFWLGNARILHATGRNGLGVVEEDEPAELRARRARFVRI